MSHPLTLNLVLQKARADRPSTVRRLNVSGAQVDDISVMEQFKFIEVCSLSVNEVSDLAPLAGCDRLKELYLRKNDVCDLFQVLHLRGLRDLTVLTLLENPISSHSCYRRYIVAALPQLQRLDDLDISADERQAAAAEFPDVTVCDVPMPMPTKRELHENRSAHGSPNQRPQRSTPAAAVPPPSQWSADPPSARGRQGSATGGVRASVTPPAADTPTPVDSMVSDGAEDSGQDGGTSRPHTSQGRLDSDVGHPRGSAQPSAAASRGVPHGNNRPPPISRPRQGGPHQGQYFDPVDEDADDDDLQSQRMQNHHHHHHHHPGHHHQQHYGHHHGGHHNNPHRGLPSRVGGTPRSGALVSTPHGLGAAIREENVVRSINLLLSELSPSGLDAVRRHLDMLDSTTPM